MENGLKTKESEIACFGIKNFYASALFNITCTIYRSSGSKVFCKKGVFRKFANFAGKHLR